MNLYSSFRKIITITFFTFIYQQSVVHMFLDFKKDGIVYAKEIIIMHQN